MTGQTQADRLVIRRRVAASREEVFAAWLDPKSVAEWMRPGDINAVDVELDPRVGGAYRITMKSPTGSYDHTGEYQVIEPPSKLVFTWISGATGMKPSIVTVELLERGDECELVLTHERLPDAEAVRRHKGGWGRITEMLAAHVARGARKEERHG